MPAEGVTVSVAVLHPVAPEFFQLPVLLVRYCQR